ncbi:MAG TPA: aldehyde dehydrogenase family protein [Nitrospiraceae bacterium]|nr:aldehyde dehydrogenase family protein [Nitrospiraceae bacterium]
MSVRFDVCESSDGIASIDPKVSSSDRSFLNVMSSLGRQAERQDCSGGEVLDRKGYFIQPTIVRDIPDDARLVTEAKFGPIVPVLLYSDIDDVVTRANDSEYGLAGTA